MRPKDFKCFAEKTKIEFCNLLKNCYSEFVEVDIKSAQGQIFTLEVFYGEDYIGFDGSVMEYNDFVRPIMHFQAKGSWSNIGLDINNFFKINAEVFDEFYELAARGELDSLIPVLKEGRVLIKPKEIGQADLNSYLFLSLKSEVYKANQFTRELLDESIASIGLSDKSEDTIDVGCVMSERKRIKALIEGYPTNLLIPFDKIDSFKAFEKEIETLNVDDKYIFVAMSFRADPMLEDSYEAVKRSVKMLRKGLTCERVDDINDDFIITDKIIDCIKRAKVMIVDLTGSRPNVYYELGYARALGKSIVLIAREDEKPHFDVCTQNIIFYKNTTTLEKSLTTRLRTIFK